MSARAAPPRPGRSYLAGAPLLVAHRGGSALAPENTMVAFRRALELWRADMLELDVHPSSDGEVMVIHDATVDRTTDGTGPVSSMTCAELQALDAGARFVEPSGAARFGGRGVRIPRLDDVLEEFPDTRVNAEIKDPRVARSLVEVVRRHAAEDRVLVASARASYRRSVSDYRGPWGASREQIVPFWFLRDLPLARRRTPRADVLQVPERWWGLPLVTRSFVEAAHARNIPVQVWTVDDPDDMRRLLALGVDGIQSDRPDLLARVLHEERGRPLPPGLTGRTDG